MTALKNGLPGLAHNRGFTLVEMMITLAVAVILTVQAVPSFTGIILNQGVKTAAYDLISALSYARSEAIKRNRPVTLSAAAGDWQQAWLLCAAPDPTLGTETQGRCPTGQVELKLRDWTHADGLAITATSTALIATAVTAVTFRSDGRVNTGLVFNICDQNASAAVARRIVRLDASGRPNLKRGASCGT